jgi:hypothetical protein
MRISRPLARPPWWFPSNFFKQFFNGAKKFSAIFSWRRPLALVAPGVCGARLGARTVSFGVVPVYHGAQPASIVF